MDILTGKLHLASNEAVCFNCGNVLTSKYQYDLVTCSCGAMAIDGGDNLRVINLTEDSSKKQLSSTKFTVIF
jgi:hypothetical protein